jgi:hypothetical protein
MRRLFGGLQPGRGAGSRGQILPAGEKLVLALPCLPEVGRLYGPVAANRLGHPGGGPELLVDQPAGDPCVSAPLQGLLQPLEDEVLAVGDALGVLLGRVGASLCHPLA